MALVLASGLTVPDTPTLHREDGSKFTGDIAVQALGIDFELKTPEIVYLANGRRASTQIGDAIGWIESFRLDAFSRAGARQVKNSIANQTNQGLFTLHVPNIEGSGNEEFLICFFEAPFPPDSETPRRRGNIQIFSAEVTEIEILGYEDNRS